MDEILIGEKKYVSSKQAAKVTGYAKDYIGQLCREGRVPARLVGRSWYVLESAIHDHRFGDQKIEQEAAIAPSSPVFSSTWDSPRYEAAPAAEVLPSVNLLKDDEAEGQSGDTDVAQRLQDSWKAWFDRVEDVGSPVPAAPAVAEEQEIREEEEEREVSVPVRAVYRQPPEELLPRHSAEVRHTSEVLYEERPQKGSRKPMRVIQVAGALLALSMASLAVLGSGYFDKYLLSGSQVGMIAGVSLYNR